METKPSEISSSKMFGGYNKRYKHFSPTLGCSMTFHIYFPPSTSTSPSHRFPECTKLFVVRLPDCRKFVAPKNLKLLAIPLCQINKNQETYGPVISGVPEMLSKFTINIIED